MRISYCDLCGCPIHNVRYFIMVVKGTGSDSYAIPQISNPNDVAKKEICEKCKGILDKVFMDRLHALNDINKEIERLFKLSDRKKR